MMFRKGALKRIRAYDRSLTVNGRLVLTLIMVMFAMSAAVSLLLMLGVGHDGELAVGKARAAGVFMTAFAFAGAALVITVFRELFDTRWADVEYSLPLSAAERFLAKLRLVLTRHILPAVLQVGAMTALTWALSDNGDARKAVFAVLMNVLGQVFFVDGAAFFCISFCAGVGECVLCTASFITLISVLPRAMTKLSDPYTQSPIHLGIGLVAEKKTAINFPGMGTSAANLGVNLMISALLFFGAFEIYRRRSGLRSEIPLGSKVIYTVTAAGVSIASLMLGMFTGSLFMTVLLSTLAEIGLAFATHRGVQAKTLAIQTAGFGFVLFLIIAGINMFSPVSFIIR